MKLTKKLLCGALVCASAFTALQAEAHPSDKIKVMTQNLYLGADIFPVIAAAQDPNPIAVPLAVTKVFQTVQATNFPERALAIAREIDEREPDVIALQEAVIWRTQIPGDYLIGNPTQAADVAYDFLTLLQAALTARGLDYVVASSNLNSDIELPMIAGFDPTTGAPIFGDVRLTDRDVTLVKNSTNIIASNPFSGHFAVNAVVNVAGATLEFTRGYTMVDVNVKGSDYRIVNTHLEVGGSEPFISLQAVQMNQLMQTIAAVTPASLPVIMLGDFNSAPTDLPFTSTSGIPGLNGLALVPPYLQAVGTGYSDVWLGREHPANGFTCCFDEALISTTATLTERIDHIFINPKTRVIKKMKSKLMGNSNADMTDLSNLHPSDHAGLYGKIKLLK